MTASLPFGSRSVMAQRREPPDSLDFFPTPPWATRALIAHVFGLAPARSYFSPLTTLALTCWEPACGEGHMAETLRESFRHVFATDIFPYGHGAVADFLDTSGTPPAVDAIITNPPFRLATEFVSRALSMHVRGVFVLCRMSWIESEDRWKLFKKRPPHIVAPFMGRVAMVKGRYDPAASSATAYAWFGWLPPIPYGETVIRWIPPEAKLQLHRPEDARRWGVKADAPLLEGA